MYCLAVWMKPNFTDNFSSFPFLFYTNRWTA